MFHLLRNGAERSALDLDSDVSIWTTLEVGPVSPNKNVNTSLFTLASAVQLTFAATSVIAIAVLF